MRASRNASLYVSTCTHTHTRRTERARKRANQCKRMNERCYVPYIIYKRLELWDLFVLLFSTFFFALHLFGSTSDRSWFCPFHWLCAHRSSIFRRLVEVLLHCIALHFCLIICLSRSLALYRVMASKANQRNWKRRGKNEQQQQQKTKKNSITHSYTEMLERLNEIFRR